MKKKIHLLLILFSLLFVFTWQACEFVKVDTPDIDVSSEFKPLYVIKGLIL